MIALWKINLPVTRLVIPDFIFVFQSLSFLINELCNVNSSVASAM